MHCIDLVRTYYVVFFFSLFYSENTMQFCVSKFESETTTYQIFTMHRLANNTSIEIRNLIGNKMRCCTEASICVNNEFHRFTSFANSSFKNTNLKIMIMNKLNSSHSPWKYYNKLFHKNPSKNIFSI